MKIFVIFLHITLLIYKVKANTDFVLSGDYDEYGELGFELDEDGDDEETLDSGTMKCIYDFYNYTGLGSIYRCIAQNNLNIISRESMDLFSVTGKHENGKSYDDIEGFCESSSSHIIQYFPRNLANFFPNLKVIYINDGRLKEIQQVDLSPFTKLVQLDLANNDIETLEHGLFSYNPQLMYISLVNNLLTKISISVFDNLKKLTDLNLSSNLCINLKTSGNLLAVKVIVSQAKQSCPSSDYVLIDETLRTIENSLVCVSSETLPIYDQKVQNLEAQFKESKFSRSTQLKERFKAVAAWKSNNIWTVKSQMDNNDAFLINFKSEVTSTMNNIKEDLNRTQNGMLKVSELENSLGFKISSVNKSIGDLKAQISSLNDRMSTIESSISKLSSIINANTRSINQFQSDVKDRLKITNYKIDENLTVQDYSKSMLIGSCAFLITLVLVIVYKKLLTQPDDLDY